MCPVFKGQVTPNYCGGCHDVYVAGNYAFTVSQDDNSLSIFDISTIASPALVGGLETIPGAHSICGQGNYLYISSTDSNSLMVVDVTDPAFPSIVGTLTDNIYLNKPMGVFYKELLGKKFVFVASYAGDNICVVNVDNPVLPRRAGYIQGTDNPNYLDGIHSIATTALEIVRTNGVFSSPVTLTTQPTIPSKFIFTWSAIRAHDGGVSKNMTITGTDTADSPLIEVLAVAEGATTVTTVGMFKTVSGIVLETGFDVTDNLKIEANISYCYGASYTDNALTVFFMEPNYTASGATITLNSGGYCRLSKGETKSASATISINVNSSCKLTGGAEWDIGKPYWNPMRRVFIQKSDGTWIDITNKVAEFGNINWQIEADYHFNEFTANNTSLVLKNEDEEFDIDKSDNYFVLIGHPQTGYRVPIRISAGYIIDGQESLINVFHGLIVDIDTSTDDTKARIDLQCISRRLRDAKCDKVGYRCTEQQIYGGESYAEITMPLGPDAMIIQAIVRKGAFPRAGYAKIKRKDETYSDEYEIFYFGQKTEYGFTYCIRQIDNTTAPEYWNVGDKIYFLLDDRTETDNKYFQFPLSPIVQDSVERVYSSDGEITIISDHDVILGLAGLDRKLIGYIDYDRGLLELGGEPTAPSSLRATFRACPRAVSFHGITKQLLEDEGMEISEIEDVSLSEREANMVSYIYGRISVAENNNTSAVVIPDTPCLALAVNDPYVYMGIGSYIIQWDNERWRSKANLGTDLIIVRLGLSSDGTIFGIAKSTNADEYGYVFKYDGNNLTFLTDQVCAYMNLDDEHEGSQWRGFSVDDDNSCVWFVYNDTTRGIARVNFDGSGYTRYSRNAEFDRSIDFVDAGNALDCVYYEIDGSDFYVKYDTLSKAGSWTQNGYLVTGEYNELISFIPIDLTYHPSENKLYLNILYAQRPPTFNDFHAWYEFFRFAYGDNWMYRLDELEKIWKQYLDNAGTWRGSFVSVVRGTTVKTDLETYSDDRTIKSRYCGGIYHNGYVWYVKGSAKAVGANDYDDLQDGEDSANGHIYRIANDVIEDMGTLAFRPSLNDKHYLRDNVVGHAAVLAVRESEDAIFFISSDAIVGYNIDYGYALGRYAKTFIPVIREANFANRSKWDTISECAVLCGYELGVSRDGKVFFRKRSADRAVLTSAINDSITTIPGHGLEFDSFTDEGSIQIDAEIITYTGKSSSAFTGCVRGAYDSVASSHAIISTIFIVDSVFVTMDNDKTLKRVNSKTPNTDEIYNYVVVPYGDFESVCNYATIGESWEGSSEQIYGRRELRIDNSFLSSDDIVIAKALAWRYYDLFNTRHSKVEVETVWQPQLDLGGNISIKQSSRTILDYCISRIKSIEMNLGSFFIRCIVTIKPNSYRENKYGYPY